MKLPSKPSLRALVNRLISKRNHQVAKRIEEYLLRWNDDGITHEDAFLNIGVCGLVGSGKSTGAILRIVLNALRGGWSVFCTTTKVTDIADYLYVAKLAGVRCIVTGPSGTITMDVLDVITRMADDLPIAVADFVVGLGGMMSPGGRHNHEDVWEGLSKQHIHNAAVILNAADGRVTLDTLHEFLVGAPTSEEQLKSPEFQKNGHWQTLLRSGQGTSNATEKRDVQKAYDFFVLFWPRLNDRTRTSIETNTFLVLGTLNRGTLWQRLSSPTANFTFESVQDQPTLVISGWPVAAMKDMGRLAQAAERFALQTWAMTRGIDDDTRPLLIVSDEFHQHCNGNDVPFLALSRSQKVCNLIAFQNRELLDNAFGGDQAAHTKTDAMLSNLGTMLMFNSVGASAEWASRRIGNKLQFTMSATSNRQWGTMPDLWAPQPSQSSATVNQQMLEIVPAHQFSTLRRGGRANGFMAECVVMASRPLSPTGLNYAKVRLPQLLVHHG